MDNQQQPRYQLKKKPIEIYEEIVDLNNTYSIVICDLQDKINSSDLLVKLFRYDAQERFLKSQGGAYLSEYANQDDYEAGIYHKAVHNFVTPLDRYNAMDVPQKEVVDAIKGLCNSFPTAFFWHNGVTDDKCSFHGLHIHLIIHSDRKLKDTWRYKNTSTKLRQHGVQIKSQKIKYFDNLTKHLLSEPRILLGVNNMALQVHITALATTTTKEDVQIDFDKDERETTQQQFESHPSTDWINNKLKVNNNDKKLQKQHEVRVPVPGTYLTDDNRPQTSQMRSMMNSMEINNAINRIPVNKTANKVDVLKALIEKYQCKTVTDLLVAIMDAGDKAELDLFRTLWFGYAFNSVFQQAVVELDIEKKQKGYTYVDTFLQNCPMVEESMTTYDTAVLFHNWCKEQKILPGDFLLKLYCVLDKKFPKLNCFAMQGASNAGKTFWTAPVILQDSVGQTIQSQDFAYMNCADKEIIQIPEMLLTKAEQVEEAKKIFEGILTMVNVKNKEPARLKRTPVLLTCNQLPWINFSYEAPTLQNRMFIYKNLVESRVLKENVPDGKGPDPRFFQQMFDYIRKIFSNQSDENPTPDAPTDTIMEYIADLVSEELYRSIENKGYTLDKLINKDVIEMNLMARYYDNRFKPPADHGRIKDINIQPWSGTNDQTNEEDLKRIVAWMKLISKVDATDFHWDFYNYRQPRLISSLTKVDYDPDSDIDTQDYKNFKAGYGIIQRLLMRIEPMATNRGTDKTRMIKTCLQNMSKKILFILRHCKNWNVSSFMDTPIDLDEELSFNAGVNCHSTPRLDNETTPKEQQPVQNKLPPPVKRQLFEAKVPKMKISLKRKRVISDDSPKETDLEKMNRSLDAKDPDETIEWAPPSSKKTKKSPYQPINLVHEYLYKEKGLTIEKMKELIDYAFSGNQECYHQVEREYGIPIPDMLKMIPDEITPPVSPLSSANTTVSGYVTDEDQDISARSSPSLLDTVGPSTIDGWMTAAGDATNHAREPGNSEDNPIVIEE